MSQYSTWKSRWPMSCPAHKAAFVGWKLFSQRPPANLSYGGCPMTCKNVIPLCNTEMGENQFNTLAFIMPEIVVTSSPLSVLRGEMSKALLLQMHYAIAEHQHSDKKLQAA